MLPRGMLAFRVTSGAPIGAHQLFDLCRGGVPGDID
jgi:hypothetical protein